MPSSAFQSRTNCGLRVREVDVMVGAGHMAEREKVAGLMLMLEVGNVRL